jgi:Flp pilus assembly protein TadB
VIDEPTARAIAYVLAALGAPALLLSFGRTVWKWWTGRSARERESNRDLVQRARDAEQERDREATVRRKSLEYASILRRQLNEAGIKPEPWPVDLSGTPKPRPRSSRSNPPKE